MARGLFVGLSTLDLIYLVAGVPEANEKINAQSACVAAGGPATNAAVAFAHWGHETQVLSAVGCHPLAQLIQGEMRSQGVTLVDLMPEYRESPPVSSIMVTAGTGERAVVSLNAQKVRATVDRIPAGILMGVEVLLVDGHQMAVSVALAQQAQGLGIPVVLDGGSWKPGLETLLPWVDYAICSGDFRPPGCGDEPGVLAYLRGVLGPTAEIAITHGAQPVYYCAQHGEGWIEVPQIQPVDTLGAGDIFHGAFCHFVLERGFGEALRGGVAIATQSCQQFGTRTWLQSDFT